jgi:hypothetical protein
MQDVAVVALAAFSATMVGAGYGAISASYKAFFVERRKAAAANKHEFLQRIEQDRQAHREELERALAEARLAVIRVSVGTQLVQDMRQTADARLDDHDLPDRIRQTRNDYPAAEAALIGLWGVCRQKSTKDAVLSLLEDLTWAFRYGKSAGGADIDPEKIDARIKKRLQELSVAVTAETQPGGLSAIA